MLPLTSSSAELKHFSGILINSLKLKLDKIKQPNKLVLVTVLIIETTFFQKGNFRSRTEKNELHHLNLNTQFSVVTKFHLTQSI